MEHLWIKKTYPLYEKHSFVGKVDRGHKDAVVSASWKRRGGPDQKKEKTMSNAMEASSRSPFARVFGKSWSGLSVAMGGIVDRMCRVAERRRQRRDLLALPDDLLKDIGVSRADVQYQVDKMGWWSR